MIGIEEFFKTATSQQKILMENLVKTAKEENELCKEINLINNSVKTGVYSPDGTSLTLCEDEDDALIISANPREKLKSIRNKMKNYMIEAVNLNMGDIGIIARNYENYVGEPLSKVTD